MVVGLLLDQTVCFDRCKAVLPLGQAQIEIEPGALWALGALDPPELTEA